MARKKAGKLQRIPEQIIETPIAVRRRPPFVRIAIILLAIGLLAMLIANKGLIVAAVVNGKPIFRWQVTSVMTSRFGKQTLEGMISETLIAQEAKKAGVSVTQPEIDGKVAAVVADLGENVGIDELLAYQGMTRGEFEDQIRLQLTVEKLLGKDIVITEDDVTNYIATNAASLTATDEAALRVEAREVILTGKINEKLQPWFLELKNNANISRFL